MSPSKKSIANENIQQATFGAGCFWAVEETFRQLPGVITTAVGYMGGHKQNPTYEDVCTDTTMHAEVVHIEYDPSLISYDHLLEVFWKNHDPTTLNRQGPDEGTQYRSAIFYYTPEQGAQAEKSKTAHQKNLKKAITTEITPAQQFWRAEEYHQKYLQKQGLGSCHV